MRTFAFSIAMLALLCPFVATADGAAMPLTLPSLFGDGMVLQQGRPVAIWGKAAPGEMVRVAFGRDRVRTRANHEGAWLAYLGPFDATATPRDLVVRSRGEKRVVKNVVVGEVWLCSGQSNMQMTMQPGPRAVLNIEQELAGANHPDIRLFKVPPRTKFAAQTDLPDAHWEVCTPEAVKTFSAVGYFFGRDLHRELNVPIGLINASYGGTPIEAWVSEGALRGLGEWKPIMDMLPGLIADSAKRAGEYEQQAGRWFIQLDSFDLGYDNGKAIWADPAFDAHEWVAMEVPGFWEDKGYPNLDGFAWYRKEVTLPDHWNAKPLRLHLTGINDMDRAWFNGEIVGQFEGTAGFTSPRDYAVPARLVHAGHNVIAVRVYDLGNNGGFTGAASDMHLDVENGAATDTIALAGQWQFKPGMDLGTVPAKPIPPVYVESNKRIPALLFNGMIAPLIPYGTRGVIWYQGEGNVGRARQYDALFPALINDWRTRFRQGDLPFLFVQLASYKPATPDANAPSDTAELRESQARALSAPNTGMAVTIDIGDADNIHPRNKQDVGKRLALLALKDVYKTDIVASGPVLETCTVSGSALNLVFNHADGGLKTRDGQPPRGFAIAGIDEVFRWANAMIEGNQIILTCNDVLPPVHVRYAWADNPDANICNSAGLPAAPFRSSIK